ncbi:MAG TPA: PRC-barrel domain-containing protein [Hyphomicrobiaceae bacterium]|nr:PRC-barrel domain-containing protein [Hyphomicrobiaceae bacterium]
MRLTTGARVSALILLVGASGAMAQTKMPSQGAATAPAPSSVVKAPISGQIVVQDANTILARDLIGQTVLAPDKTKIGSISDLILSKDAKTVEGFVIGVGGFLGIGEKSVAMKLDRLQMTQDTKSGGLQLTMDVKKDELANTPSFKSRRDQEAERQAFERARSQPQPGGGMSSGGAKPGQN